MKPEKPGFCLGKVSSAFRAGTRPEQRALPEKKPGFWPDASNDRPAVLVVCNTFRPWGLGGLENIRLELTRRYQFVRPIVLTDLLDSHSDGLPLPVEVHRVPLLGTGLLGRIRSSLVHRGANVMVDRAISLLPTVLRLCRNHGVRCIECGNSNLGFVGYLAHRRLGIPYIMHVSSSQDPVVVGNYGHFSRPISRLMLKHAAAIIALSDSTRQYVRGWVHDPARVHTVRMGVDNVRFSPGPCELAADLAPRLQDRTALLSVSRLVARKGIDTVLRAIPAIAHAVPDVLYVIVGDGPDRSRLEGLARSLQMTDRVLFAGARTGDELVNLYRACRLFVLVSRFQEGLGIVALEAAACGKPVVVGDRGGQPETVEHGVTGYSVPAESVQAVADACVNILCNSALAQAMGQAGLSLATTMSWDRAAEAVEQHLLAAMQYDS